jgi:hypothetical protein
MLQWLTHTRPDISYGVNLAARWSHNPGKEQWAHLRHFLRYINGTRKAGLSFGANELEEALRIITDADFAGCLDTRRSTSGVICQVFGSTVSHISRRQSQTSDVSEEDEGEGVTNSTMEAELIAMYTGAKEGERMQKILQAFKVDQPTPVPLLCDNWTTVGKITG